MRRTISARTAPKGGAPGRPARPNALAAAALAAALGLGGLGCAAGGARAPAPPPRLVDDAGARALGLGDPLALDAKIVHDVEATVGRIEMPLERFRHVVRYVTSHQSLNFEYDPYETYGAQQAFYHRRGDCLSFANLVNAIARHVGVPTYFVYINDVPHHYEHAGWFFNSSHVAVGYTEGSTNYVSDFPRQPDEWTISLFRRITDDDAAALFYNSLAVDRLVAGRLDESDRILGYLAGRSVNVAEVYNNYGITLKRRSRPREAQSILEYAAARFPAYAPLYNNRASLAIAAGRPDQAAHWLERYERVAERDPFAHYVRGVDHFRARRFELAAASFQKAVGAYDQSATVLAWLVRAQIESGDDAAAAKNFARLRALPGGPKFVGQLLERYPGLGLNAPKP